MSAQHTQGLLHVGGDTIIYEADGWAVANATVYHGRHEPEASRENARRLVACWNACDGIETAILELDNVAFIERMKKVAALEQQRDELLAALEHLEHNARKSGADMGLALDVASDAIAKAKVAA